MSQRLGDLLVKEKVITPEQLEQAVKTQKDGGGKEQFCTVYTKENERCSFGRSFGFYCGVCLYSLHEISVQRRNSTALSASQLSVTVCPMRLSSIEEEL